MTVKRMLSFFIALGVLGLALNLAPAARAAGATIIVAPGQSIQAALDRAQPGDTIRLHDGLYHEDLHSVRDGRVDAPIIITGSERAVLTGAGAGRLVEINHNFITLDGFTIDGKRGGSTSDKLVYVLGKQARTPLLGLVIRTMRIGNAGGECVRLRYFVQNAEIANNTIGPCGLVDFPGGKWGGDGKNGEGVYIGTAPEQRGDGKNPDASPDVSNNNHVHHNTINTQGNECVDIKESATGTIVEYNRCTGQRDPDSAGLDSRGSGNVFRFNEVWGSRGAGIRLGGDSASDGTANQVYGNRLHDNAGGGVKVQRDPQATICGNVLANNGVGASIGTYGSRYNPSSTCPFPIDQPPVSTPIPIDEPLPPLPTDLPTRTPRIPPTVPSGATVVPATATPPSTTPRWHLRAEAPLVIDATRGQLAPNVFTVRNERGRAYLTTTGRGKLDQGEKQGARYDLVVDTAGRYVVWVLGRGHGDDANSVFVRAGATGSVAVHFDDDGWRWERARSPITFAAGQTALRLFPRERGTDVQTLVITRDQDWTPATVGNQVAP